MKIVLTVVVLLIVNGCASNLSVQDSKRIENDEVFTVLKEFPPQVWSDHKVLNISESVCSSKGLQVLDSLGFVQVIKSKYGEYVYGNYSNNRAAIKCVPANAQTFLYVIVAGPKKAVVERLRNEIMWQY